jgi:hypothetical protein
MARLTDFHRQHSAKCKPIRIAVSMVLEESRYGHKTIIWVWDDFHGVSSFLKKGVALCLGYCGWGVG